MPHRHEFSEHANKNTSISTSALCSTDVHHQNHFNMHLTWESSGPKFYIIHGRVSYRSPEPFGRRRSKPRLPMKSNTYTIISFLAKSAVVAL